jgi:hypothetical protein
MGGGLVSALIASSGSVLRKPGARGADHPGAWSYLSIFAYGRQCEKSG